MPDLEPIRILRTDDSEPCRFCAYEAESGGELNEKLARELLTAASGERVGVCMHHEALLIDSLPAGYQYTPTTSGRVKGTVHRKGEDAPELRGDPHTAPEQGVPLEQAQAEWEAEEARRLAAEGQSSEEGEAATE